jgi:molybdopterin converting factor small subunit
MAVVVLRHPLRDLAGGETRVEVSGATVGEALDDLVRAHPRLKTWVLDDQGDIRRHVNVFVDGLRADRAVALRSSSELNIIQAISGG